jgi:hypothetical protein
MKTTVDRFWEKVQKTETCWLWTGSKRYKGYGAIGYRVNGKNVNDRAHRFSYRLHIGPIPTGLFVLHTCDTPACVNPEHLFLGTNEDNVHDMMAKGKRVPAMTHCGDAARYIRGHDHHAAKFTEEDIRFIRQLYQEGGWSYGTLAKRFGVIFSTIQKIVKRERWKHIP